MERLVKSALKIRQRTFVTTFFAQNGFKIDRTDFDFMIFSLEELKVRVTYDLCSNVRSISVLNTPKTMPRFKELAHALAE
ncbi:hypothetical protein [Vibrio intestinalis]|uniref:hypothetical protein n=1 Tax=Vibrio intestinalis TaxID=2933291 RepID=UPI0021A4E217|nr:hypothetical protein [Vibrio intestinalis]